MELDQQQEAAGLRNMQAPQIPRYCGQCGYDLHGLSHSGRCPECGFKFSSDQLVIFGCGGPTHAVAGFQLARSLKWNIALMALQILNASAHALMRRYGIALIWGLAATIHLFVILRRRVFLSSAPAPYQVRFSRSGYGHRAGCDSVRLARWKPENRVRVENYAPDQIRICVEPGQLNLIVESSLDKNYWVDAINQAVCDAASTVSARVAPSNAQP